MQMGPSTESKSGALTWARNSWRQIVSAVAALALAIALLAAAGTSIQSAAADTDEGDRTEQVAGASWTSEPSNPMGTSTPIYVNFSRGPSWS